MADRARHAFGSLESVDKALQTGAIDAYDILFLDGDTKPKVGWIDKNGVFRLVENDVDITDLENQMADLESEIASKTTMDEVNAKIDEKISEVNASYEVIEF